MLFYFIFITQTVRHKSCCDGPDSDYYYYCQGDPPKKKNKIVALFVWSTNSLVMKQKQQKKNECIERKIQFIFSIKMNETNKQTKKPVGDSVDYDKHTNCFI